MASSENYQVFRECLSSAMVEKFSAPAQPKKARRSRGAVSQRRKQVSTPEADDQSLPDRASPEELAEFVDVRSATYSERGRIYTYETFPALPPSLQTLTYTPPPPQPPPTSTKDNKSTTTSTTLTDDNNNNNQNDGDDTTDPRTLAETLCTTTLPASVHDTLTTYALLPPTPNNAKSNQNPAQETATESLISFFTPILTDYITSVTKPPPVWASTRTEACEICARDWIPLSYHHLIPRSVHAKVLKKGWHPEWMLNSVAWLCRACHSFVHRMAGNEELAREYFTVDRILEREDVRVWANWVGRVRWKAR
ncbi:HNH endonuclease [Aspergillus saccharolyticus JOP 1030-1]|uniref:HNH domain-containing protein n=1 Tax=Aspergillus saccharolyticus JOP 1030-1 TaxID=1450539 RepID=A0A318Z9Z0_9EURO|nr:hypothetical protein BP01DRAFT_348981 [Aspergillus saccharolyticus JOP 1030-1]PYH41523.1 hypothetical protein BP01DRAFT_348981 [Aspergillus saccharolyticus JOP 1030-1]